MQLVEKQAIFGHMAALSDPTRCRLMLVLGRQELTVSEICRVLRLPQSTASRQLKILADGHWVQTRREGTRRLYRLVPGDLEPPARELWSLAQASVSASPGAGADGRRLERVLAERRSRSREFFATAAQDWNRLREELFGTEASTLALLGLLDEQAIVGDLGCGTGTVAAALAPFVHRVIGVDGSPAMLEAARRRSEACDNVELRHGELEHLPIDDQALDAATLILVLHHLPDPGRVLEEARRTLRPGGRLLIVDLLQHERQEYQRQMGHVWLGFTGEQVLHFFQAAGFRSGRFRLLPVDPAARGPGLFAATAAAPEVRPFCRETRRSR